MTMGKMLIAAGVLLILLGFFFHSGGRIPFFGKLPGDLRIEKENFSFYFPLTTCILISLVVSLVLWLFRR